VNGTFHRHSSADVSCLYIIKAFGVPIHHR
jgi:hypothetical protein